MKLRALGLLWVLAAAAGCSEDTPTSSRNLAPVIRDVVVNPFSTVLGGQVRATVLVSDPNGDPVTISWRAAAGTFADSTTAATTWTAPQTAGDYALVATAGDGELSVTDSVIVQVGNASLIVTSDPPGAFIELDGQPLGEQTPHRFPLLAAGLHTVELSSVYYAYERSAISLELVHAREDSIHFGTTPAFAAVLGLGRTDLLEIGGIAFLPGGTGILYTARTASGTGLYNSTLSPTPRPGNGALIASDVRLNEPVAVSADGARFVFVLADGRPMVAAYRDDQGDGLIDAVTDLRLLNLSPRFGPALSHDDRMAFTSTPSDEPAGTPVFWGAFQDSLLVGIHLATSGLGKMPSWEPGSDRLAYARDGLILVTTVDEASLAPSDTLVAGGYATAPAWGPWGPKHVAYLWGEGAGDPHALRLAAVGTPHGITVVDGLEDPRFLAWSPTQLLVAVTRNRAGRGEVLLVSGLPVP